MKKKIIALVTMLTLTMGALAGCGSKPDETTGNDTSSKDSTTQELNVGIVLDTAGKGDKSFNDSAVVGSELIKDEFGIEAKVLESKSDTDYVPNITQLSKISDLTFGIGFTMQNSIEEVADQNTDKTFVLIDAISDKKNVVSIAYKDQEAAFLMGVIAGKMTKTNQIGFIGGMTGDVITRFEVGFAAGVKAVNPEAAENLIADKDGGNGINTIYVGSFEDSAKGQEAASSLYNKGCDIIYHASGSTGLGLLNEAKKRRDQGENVWAIGVDSDQAQTNKENASAILSSSIKRIDIAIKNTVEEKINGSLKNGTSETLGLKEGAIDIAETTSDNTPKDVVDLVNKYRDAIIDGKITVPTNMTELKDFAPEAL